MGTNYYVKTDACKCCGHKENDIHIGKFSAGWKFAFNSRFKSAKEWFDFLKGKTVHNEYDEVVSLDWLKLRVEETKNGIWLYDMRYEENFRYKREDRLEYLDSDGYRFVTAGDFS